jgi:hypothetical protein
LANFSRADIKAGDLRIIPDSGHRVLFQDATTGFFARRQKVGKAEPPLEGGAENFVVFVKFEV